jgi:dienelactone hydrolase
MAKWAAAVGIGALLVAGVAVAQVRPDLDAQMRADGAAQRIAYAKQPDTPGSGPYPAIKTLDADFPGHVVYRPVHLGALGARKLPVLLWGNGGCSDDGASARLFLSEIASHGYIAVAPGALLSGPGTTPAPPPPPGGPALAVRTTSDDVRRGLDQAMAANARKRSALRGRLDLSRVAVAGHSCGGLQALQLAGDPRIKAVVVMHSGVFADGSNPIAGLTVDKALLKTLHTPVLYILGGPLDIAYPNGTDDVARIDHVPVFLADHPVRHGGTFAQPNGGNEAQVVTAWLDWQLLHKPGAATWFTGAKCRLCADASWTITRKKID